MNGPNSIVRGFSGLTAWQIVAQSQAIHPTWTADEHLWYLTEEEGVNPEHLPAAPGERSPIDTINRWLAR